jgi:uncharacterized protein (DUF1501 family)
MNDDEFPAVQRRLSIPASADPSGVSRRRFLQLAIGGAGAAVVLPSWLAAEAAGMPDGAMAAPIGPNDGVLILIQMGGGNDGLNTIIPTGDGHYYSQRNATAIAAHDCLPIGAPGFGMNPNLVHIHDLWAAGHVAAVQGVGEIPGDLSHFSSTATWMQGYTGTPPPTGWVGRYLDGLGADPLHGVCLGTSTPLHCVGETTKATALPTSFGDAFGADPSDPENLRMYDCVQAYGSAPTGLGPWADALAGTGSLTIDLAQTVAPLYGTALPDGYLTRQMVLAARLVNANLGLRVISCVYGDFDSHASQMPMHTQRMQELDTAVNAFYQELSGPWSDQVVILTWSEFGRRLEENESHGTDHGEASTILLIGGNVAGGLYGEAPSLAPADLHWGDPVSSVDFRSVYATILDSWLAADSTSILGGTYENLGLFASGPG